MFSFGGKTFEFVHTVKQAAITLLGNGPWIAGDNIPLEMQRGQTFPSNKVMIWFIARNGKLISNNATLVDLLPKSEKSFVVTIKKWMLKLACKKLLYKEAVIMNGHQKLIVVRYIPDKKGIHIGVIEVRFIEQLEDKQLHLYLRDLWESTPIEDAEFLSRFKQRKGERTIIYSALEFDVDENKMK